MLLMSSLFLTFLNEIHSGWSLNGHRPFVLCGNSREHPITGHKMSIIIGRKAIPVLKYKVTNN